MVTAAGKYRFSGYRSGARLQQSAGFSLIELLIVILIIGLGVRFVSINVDSNQPRQLRQQAKDFVNAAALIAEEAVLSRQQWGIDFYLTFEEGYDRYGYRWLIRKDQRWQLAELPEGQSADVQFPPDVQLQLTFDDVEQEIGPKLAFPEMDENNNGNATKTHQQNGNTEQQDKQTIKPHIWILSSGEMTAFTLSIFARDTPDNKIIISGDELGRVSMTTGATDDEPI